MPDEPSLAARPPEDVLDWLEETYDEEGQSIWLRAWLDGDRATRERMNALVHIDPMGT